MISSTIDKEPNLAHVDTFLKLYCQSVWCNRVKVEKLSVKVRKEDQSRLISYS